MTPDQFERLLVELRIAVFYLRWILAVLITLTFMVWAFAGGILGTEIRRLFKKGPPTDA